MAISVYSGLPGSGKSYEVVLSIIIPGIRAGRRVVTNISGIDNDAIRAYCVDKYGMKLDGCGHIEAVQNHQVESPHFLPFDEEQTPTKLVLRGGKPVPAEYVPTGTTIETFCKPGDLICIDEAYKIWGTDQAICREHRVFFREHRHFADPKTGVTCDLVIMTQDIGDLHKILKAVVEQSFKCHKAKGIGREDLYTITMWEGVRQTQKLIVKDWTQTYDKEIFPLYKSYHAGQGKEVATDDRQNILKMSTANYIKLAIFVAIAIFAMWRLIKFFSPSTDKKDQKPSTPAQLHQTKSQPTTPPPAQPTNDKRIAGIYKRGTFSQAIVMGPKGMELVDLGRTTGSGLLMNYAEGGTVITRGSAQVEAKKGLF